MALEPALNVEGRSGDDQKWRVAHVKRAAGMKTARGKALANGGPSRDRVGTRDLSQGTWCGSHVI